MIPENEEWLDFVCSCRKGDTNYNNYDVINGNVADDDVFETINLYLNGIWSKEQALQQLKATSKNS